MTEDLDAGLARISRVPQLLVACDYDGTIAPQVDDPMDAVPNRATSAALRKLASLPQTNVAVISGRSLRDLAALSRLPDEIMLVGSHGSEFDIGFARALGDEASQRLTAVREQLTEISARHPGTLLEPKPASVTFHHRGLDPDAAESAVAEVMSGPGSLHGVRYRRDQSQVELLVVQTDKGKALHTIRRQVGASAVLFLGDSASDEDAFVTLSGPDIGIKVGGGDTRATFRVPDPDAVAELLAQLCELRADWLAGAGLVPIEEHSFLSDNRTAAIVTPAARVTWLCVPRIDSAPVFAELLGGPHAGYFSVGPVDGSAPTGQRYVDDTMLLETTWKTMRTLDYLDCSSGRARRTAGRSDLIRVVEGGGRARIEFAPRLNFGRTPSLLQPLTDGLAVQGSSDLLALRAEGVEWRIVEAGDHQTAVAEIDLDAGPVVLEFRCGTASVRPDATDEPERREATARYWSKFADALEVPDTPAARLVRRSAITLKALCHGPTGAILAAPTTSLPEDLGGIRNWDYRYCWLRDAALSAAALVRLGSHREAMSYLDWVLDIVDGRDDPERLQPLYLVTGRHLPPEAEITELSGYGGSRPVRIGNAAEHQVQLDVFGPIVDLVALLLDRGEPMAAQHWRLTQAMVDAVDRRWEEPDNGIWEIRKAPRHHTYSKVMCWVTVDRAVKAAEYFGETKTEPWEELRDRIGTEVLEKAWKPEVGAFTAAYEGTDLDASVLMIGLSGLLAADDERFVATVNAVDQGLRSGPTVYRYLHDDGLPGTEGGFNLMTSWLIDALCLIGRADEARSLFEQLCTLAGPTGLFAEEYDPSAGRALGNHPQAYSHLGLIGNALTLGNGRIG